MERNKSNWYNLALRFLRVSVAGASVHESLESLTGMHVDPQNRKNTSARLELKKYNKYLRRMTVHREIK